jgi:hypothetical protein
MACIAVGLGLLLIKIAQLEIPNNYLTERSKNIAKSNNFNATAGCFVLPNVAFVFTFKI